MSERQSSIEWLAELGQLGVCLASSGCYGRLSSHCGKD